MQALGLIETRGLIAAIESADVMLKAADVSLVEKTLVGGGLVTITVTGDVAAAKAAVEAAVAAVNRLSETALVSQHVIPRPHENLENIIVSTTPPESPQPPQTPPPSEQETSRQEQEIEEELSSDSPELVVETTPEGKAEMAAEDLAVTTIKADEIGEESEYEEEAEQQMIPEEIHKENVDLWLEELSLSDTMKRLSNLRVQKLRTLAREYKDFGITGRAISKADKKLLLTEFEKYYGV